MCVYIYMSMFKGLSRPQIRLLMRIITTHYSMNSTGEYRVDVGEFLGRFKVVYDQALKLK